MGCTKLAKMLQRNETELGMRNRYPQKTSGGGM